MCGIFGIVLQQDQLGASSRQVSDLVRQLFKYSARRGKDASGLAVFENERLRIYRSSHSGSILVKDRTFREFLHETITQDAKTWSTIGHCRLATDGAVENTCNNQPIETDFSCGVHNGIIVNDDLLWKKHPELKRITEIDTEVFLRLLDFYSQTKPLSEALADVFSEIEGTASVIIYHKASKTIIVATNYGSLYYTIGPDMAIFASERSIMERLARRKNDGEIAHLGPNRAILLCPETFQQEEILLPGVQKYVSGGASGKSGHAFRNATLGRISLEEKNLIVHPDNRHLRRCSRCILPQTVPFIDFDERGVCNYCRFHQPLKTAGAENLRRIVEPYRSRNGEPDCLLAFSGGRDSSYGLHLLKREFGMNPIAFSYDWGVLTDIGRRNQSRMCAQLGVEQIVISADIAKKRENIRKNINAWLRRPDLGVIPLFMAGDKQFFYCANKIKKETGIKLLFFCMNHLERVDFKAGFAGVNNIGFHNGIFEGKRFLTISVASRLKLALYYFKQFLLNPKYLNGSLPDTFWAYLCYYFIPQDHISLYEYVPWEEKKIDETLISLYNWETSGAARRSTWRIGDGTAAFYNYIYRTVCGFTENDGLRSNQIREGQMDRKEAMSRIQEENIPRTESIVQYLEMIHVDPQKALKVINAMPRMY